MLIPPALLGTAAQVSNSLQLAIETCALAEVYTPLAGAVRRLLEWLEVFERGERPPPRDARPDKDGVSMDWAFFRSTVGRYISILAHWAIGVGYGVA